VTTSATTAPGELEAPDPPAPAERSEPTHHREQFHCPDCGKRFTKNVRRGLYSRCPKCSGVAVGRIVLEKIASGKVTLSGARRRDGARPRTTVASFPAQDRRPAPVSSTPAPPSPLAEPASPPSQPAHPSFLGRLFGVAGSEPDDELESA
jgi:Zn-finger nucleic acid-binding protein